MAESVRRLQGHPLTTEASHGFALGDGHGMEDLVPHIAPLFQQETSLARWVAIRGALLFLDMICPSDREWHELMPIMGLAPIADPQTGEPTAAVLDRNSPITSEVEQNILGLFWAIASRWQSYAEVSEMSIQQVNADPRWSRIGPPMALDFITWAAVAMHRTGQASSGLITGMPEVGQLEQPGWYADPLFARCERYWDASDWTERIRVKDGRRWMEQKLPLH